MFGNEIFVHEKMNIPSYTNLEGVMGTTPLCKIKVIIL